MTDTAQVGAAAGRDALAACIAGAIFGSLPMQAIDLGERLGLYRVLDDRWSR